MKKTSARALLGYLQERFRDVLINLEIDVIQVHRPYFSIGFPTYKNNGTEMYNVFVLSDGTIQVKKTRWDESMGEREKHLGQKRYKSIDEWMKIEFKALPSSSKSGKRRNYRNIPKAPLPRQNIPTDTGSKEKKRPSPSESATRFPVGTTKKGNDGNMWVVGVTKANVKRWKRGSGRGTEGSGTLSLGA